MHAPSPAFLCTLAMTSTFLGCMNEDTPPATAPPPQDVPTASPPAPPLPAPPLSAPPLSARTHRPGCPAELPETALFCGRGEVRDLPGPLARSTVQARGRTALARALLVWVAETRGPRASPRDGGPPTITLVGARMHGALEERDGRTQGWMVLDGPAARASVQAMTWLPEAHRRALEEKLQQMQPPAPEIGPSGEIDL